MKNYSILNLLVFTCFLVIGYTFSIRFYQAGKSTFQDSGKNVSTERLSTLPSMKNGQHSLLLIGTNTITSKSPHLESVWLASFFDGVTNIQLLPIFPTKNSSVSDFESQLDHVFSLVDDKGSLRLGPAFLNILTNHNYWWSGYIIFDETALAKIAKSVENSEAQLNPTAITQVGTLLADELIDPQKAYTSQLPFLQSLCRSIVGVHPAVDLSQVGSQISNHILTNLDLSQLQMGMDSMTSTEQRLTCRFPTLEIARIEP